MKEIKENKTRKDQNPGRSSIGSSRPDQGSSNSAARSKRKAAGSRPSSFSAGHSSSQTSGSNTSENSNSSPSRTSDHLFVQSEYPAPAQRNAGRLSAGKAGRDHPASAQSKGNTAVAPHASRVSSWVMIVMFFGICAVLGLSSILMPDQEVSRSERRKLRQFPELSVSSVLSGSFGNSFEDYALDQLPERDLFLDLRSLSARYLFGNLDDGGIVSYDGSLVKLEREEAGSLDYAVKIFDGIYNKYLKDSDCKVYLAIVPDKAYFLSHNDSLALLDYDEFLAEAEQKMGYATSIDLTRLLSLSDYYHTDSHWNQVRLLAMAEHLAGQMGVHILTDYDQLTAKDSFEGVYAGQSAWPADKDTLEYLYNSEMDDWTVYSYEKGTEIPLYNLEAAAGLDPYDLFLGGNTGLIRIDNPHGEKGKELVIFRDSFGSALVPLIASGYETTYVVDIRFVPSAQIGRYIDFTDQDVLFMYSTSVLNHSSTLK